MGDNRMGMVCFAEDGDRCLLCEIDRLERRIQCLQAVVQRYENATRAHDNWAGNPDDDPAGACLVSFDWLSGGTR